MKPGYVVQKLFGAGMKRSGRRGLRELNKCPDNLYIVPDIVSDIVSDVVTDITSDMAPDIAYDM